MTSTISATASFQERLAGIRVHDVDTHIAEPSDLWTSRMPKWGNLVPHVRDDPGLTDGKLPLRSWYAGDTKICEQQPFFVGGNYDEDTARGAYDPMARLAWMDRNGVYSQVLYPNVVAFYPSVFVAMEPELGVECVRTYNDFQTEFCAVAPDRLIPLTNLPWWNVEASVKEIERCHEEGHKGVNFGWDFPRIGFPRLRDVHWEPIFKTAEERGLSINFHVGFNSQSLENDMTEFGVEGILDTISYTAKFFLNNANCITELIMGGLCDRYPTLNFVSVESGCGFLPFLMEGLDWQYVAMNLHKEFPNLLLPSEYFRRQVYGTFWFERSIVSLIDEYPDNFMFQSDFPHSTSLTPTENNDSVLGPHDTIVANLSTLAPELLEKVLHDNAARVYGLP